MLKRVVGCMLVIFVLAAASTTLCGIWGLIDGETTLQLFSTFCVAGGTTLALGYCVDKFKLG